MKTKWMARILLIVLILALSALACGGGGGGGTGGGDPQEPDSYNVTATYGADLFHGQLTAMDASAKATQVP